MHTFISSLQNQRIKQAVRLNNRRQRDLEQRTLVEGVREVSRALASGLTPYEAFYCPQIVTDPEAQQCLARLAALADQGQTELFEVTTAVFEKSPIAAKAAGLCW
ncbi:MAG: hypothetical protein IPF56_11010 [Chloroflexi bacterium]|nr:hypothetical protein [Chloroflexota bacterium]